MRARAASALCAALALVLPAAARAQAAGAPKNLTFEGRDSFSVPFELVDNRIFVGVWLDGRGPFKFILDTGGYGGLSLETARRVGLRLGNEVQGRGAGSTPATARPSRSKGGSSRSTVCASATRRRSRP